ncbi:FHA domain-containing protein [Undibacterium sp. RTI2.1]|uniref:FHA domain-containing protein n=1 Tax=unclassified Undibacterium TaxID=2630295 RepID=UPI002AB467F1|nr:MULTISPECIES: FHA domain-containing protein [unclassified Undibacterium]MDY7540154.1 FHA domain-containing protein [Undibacterium sp. 5I1]MEB0030328.1 FHA domain-containing protein [Undibacterium sp. RTI2.1]MEB0115392.1 FHA domain-containing protein [Undibacterium sp. RTI2.2]MEB0230599.1 FHA domain-containing protein [Undibacterium sp. 10I3]MEB0257081.1 FHA domain-containing protein [Undibacterium sp. 5I1]
MSNICPKGHFSTDIDYCSECGSAIKLPVSASSSAGSASNLDKLAGQNLVGNKATTSCPDCMTVRRPDARFCEVCRYDFEKAMSFSGLQSGLQIAQPLPALNAVVVDAVAAVNSVDTKNTAITPVDDATQISLAADASVHPSVRLKLRILVDSSLYKDPDPSLPCPIAAAEKEYHLDLDEQTLGRQFEGRGIHPEIVVQDPGISRRHLKLMRDGAGQITVLELGSANGTELNQANLEPGVVTALKAGDQLTLGMWTRICVESR